MALKSLVLFSLLVLVLLVLEGAQPSLAQDFQRKHMDTSNGPFGRTYCNQMMRRRNLLRRTFNTFVHASLAAVQAVCREPNIRCRNGQNNCHRSRNQMSITDCILTRRRPSPNYRTINRRASIIIACVGNPPVPVHFDGSR
ncbi:ribonuclease pancreatic-like [Talpa occidentalis]|uniref:ribonuclease pancreatic-like n=1 Tax=Talpa occidentalis TaxID=50954 RepID=UPI00188EA9DC|nr:ribonuclease pancreatic-like [Talpa occidentalis]